MGGLFPKKSIEDSKPLTEDQLRRSQVDEIKAELFNQFVDSPERFSFKVYVQATKSADEWSWITKKLANHKTIFGVAHVALQIGNFRVHWLEDSWVHISEFRQTEGVMLVLDPVPHGLLRVKEKSPDKEYDNIQTICEVISDWDRRRIYGLSSCTCVDFVMHVLKKLRINPETSFSKGTAAWRYLRWLQAQDSPSSAPMALIRGDGIEPLEAEKWHTHDELEAWHTDEKEEKLQQDEKVLLKGFHRAFQYRTSNEPNPKFTCRLGEITLQKA